MFEQFGAISALWLTHGSLNFREVFVEATDARLKVSKQSSRANLSRLKQKPDGW